MSMTTGACCRTSVAVKNGGISADGSGCPTDTWSGPAEKLPAEKGTEPSGGSSVFS